MVNIQEFKLGSFFVDSKHFIGNIKIADNKIRYWDRPDDYTLEMDEIESVLKLSPNVIIIGTGAGGLLKVSDAIKQRILRNNIEIVIDKTQNVINLINSLSKEKKKFAAIL